MAQSRETFERNFWLRVERGSACWLWCGSLTGKGYGIVHWTGFDGRRYAHRVAWELTHGPVPRGLFVLHRCDNPPCVRPDHLFVGTLRDNSLDMVAKGRGRNGDPRGERNGRAKLRDSQVHTIRERYARGERNKAALAREYGVTSTMIRYVVTGAFWRHLLPTPVPR